MLCVVIHPKNRARLLTDYHQRLMREYDEANGGTIGDGDLRAEIRRTMLLHGIPYTTRTTAFGTPEGYWDLGGGNLVPTTTDRWRRNETYCARCQMQRRVPHVHRYWLFWVIEYLR